MGALNVKPRTIFCRDNLDILEGLNSECVDLIYLDPPFNKKKVFTAPIGSSAEGAEFSDIFREEDIKDGWVKSIEYENPELYSYLCGVKAFSNNYNYCYLVYMTIRLLECHRILKAAGSVYLHCDPTISHYLKIVLDCIFGEKCFCNEIIWHYRRWTGKAKKFQRLHDVIFFYTKSKNYKFNVLYTDYTEGAKSRKQQGIINRFKDGEVYLVSNRSLDKRGVRENDIWHIPIINSQSKERTGYPTQKPLALLERIISASSDGGDIVLDPFCGCATTCIAAEKLGRYWIGIDVSLKAYELVKKRIKKEVALPLIDKSPHYSAKVPKRDEAITDREQGYVYIISNDNWEGRYKVGIAKDPQRRLNSYQTSDPFRAYKLVWSVKTPHYKEIEAAVHQELDAANEWVRADIEKIKKTIKKYQRKLP